MTDKATKLDRVYKALSHKDSDVVAVGDFFWTGFLNKCKDKWGENFDPYRHFDLDYVVINPNMDPHIKDFEILKDDGHNIVVKTGFEATICRRDDLPMPHFESFSINEPEEMESFLFDKPDESRLNRAGDDQINCVGDALGRAIPS